MAIDLKRTPKRALIKQRLLAWIDEQGLQPGDRILSQNQLAAIFQTTPVTIHKALTELCEEGQVHRRRGVGTFVGPIKPTSQLLSVCLVLPAEELDRPENNPDHWSSVQTCFREFMQAVGHQGTLSTRAVSAESPAPQSAEALRGHDVVFFHYSTHVPQLMRYLVEQNIVPTVRIGLPMEGVPTLSIDHDRAGGVRRAVRYLVERGHERIGFIGNRAFWGDMALEGYEAGLREFGLPSEPMRHEREGGTRREGFLAATRLLGRGASFDALVCDCDLTALGVIDGLRQKGVRVPADVSVMGYDGIDAACGQPPYLTSVRIPHRELVERVLEMVRRAPGKPLPHEHISMVGPILAGQTVVERFSHPPPASPSVDEGHSTQ